MISVIVTDQNGYVETLTTMALAAKKYAVPVSRIVSSILDGTLCETKTGKVFFDWSLDANEDACDKVELSFINSHLSQNLRQQTVRIRKRQKD